MNDNHPNNTRPAERRADLDELAYNLRRQGLTFREIAKQLGVSERMAERRVKRHERIMREGLQLQRSPRPRE